MNEPMTLLSVTPGASLTVPQSQRLTCLAVVLGLVAGRSVPIQVVDRLAEWAYSGAREP